jgi:hypothetical protein
MTMPENAIPAGSQAVDMPPAQEPTQESIPGQATQEAIDQAAKEQLILGKFKSPEDVVPAYQALEQDHGRLGSEVGMLRKQNEALLNVLNRSAQPPSSAAPQQPAVTDYDKLLVETTNAVEAGDLSIGEGLRKVAELTAAKTAQMAKDTYMKLDSDRAAQTFFQKFQQDHPDFQEALQSGALDTIKSQNPIHDNVSAYFEWKAAKNKAEAETKIQDAYEKGKTEMAKLAKGVDPTGRVLGKSGSEVRATNQPSGPVTESDKIQGMLSTLKAARGG